MFFFKHFKLLVDAYPSFLFCHVELVFEFSVSRPRLATMKIYVAVIVRNSVLLNFVVLECASRASAVYGNFGLTSNLIWSNEMENFELC